MYDIDLNHDEEFLYNHIVWDSSALLARTSDEQEEAFAAAAELAQLLFDRKAIPKIRLDMFSNPDLNLAGRGKSPLQLLEQNHVTTRHPAFLKHLWFFIHGPKLPVETIEGAKKIADDDNRAFGDALKQLLEFVSEQSKKHHFGASDATECEKLAHELGWGRHADQFRKASLSAKH
jgi:hypothetical protein